MKSTHYFCKPINKSPSPSSKIHGTVFYLPPPHQSSVFGTKNLVTMGTKEKTHTPWIPETQKELTKKVWMGLWGGDGAGISEAGEQMEALVPGGKKS